MTAPRDLLSPEERALAARLAASAGSDAAGPSAALDARILAAARAAAAAPAGLPGAPATAVPAAAIAAERQRRHARRRGPQWARVAGVAASLVLVVGLGWRLQLEDAAQRDANDTAAAREEVVGLASAADPLPPPVVADAAANPEAAAAAARPAAVPQVPATEDAQAVPPVHAEQPLSPRTAARKAAPAPVPASDPAPQFSPPPPAPPAPASAPPPPPAAMAGDAARAEGAHRVQAREAAAAASTEADRVALDRIEVTGSRIAIASVPVGDDARLPLSEWMARIRARRDAGDIDGARASAQRLRAAHPRVALPDDLAALLATDAP